MLLNDRFRAIQCISDRFYKTNNWLKIMASVFINELHYDNDGTDLGEAIEIAGPAGTDLNGWSIELYNGSNGTLYNTNNLSGTISDRDSGFGTVAFYYPTNGIQNGSPDGLALIDPSDSVIQFLSYEGSFTAVGGTADGQTSNDIGVMEGSSTPIGFSLQLTGTGTDSEDFTWNEPSDDNFGSVNDGQSFSGDSGNGDDGTTSKFVVINEVDADTPGSDSAEFVELYDGGTGNTSLDGLVAVLYNGNGDSSYAAFDLDGFSTDSNGFFVLGNEGVANVGLTFSNNTLQNGADAVAIYQGEATDFPNGTAVTSDNLVDAIVYDTNDSDDSELLSGLGRDTQFNEDANGDKDNDSNSRVPDGTGSFFAQAATPGTANESSPPPAEFVPIYEIQGTALTSPLEGQSVNTTGIVTAVDSNGFYLQDAAGDSNTATSDGIFVFTSSEPVVSVGDQLEVAGTVSEFTPGGTGTGNLSISQISNANVTTVSTGNVLPDAVIIGQGGRIPPDESIDDNPDSYNPDADGLDFFESLEGMLVTARDAVAVSGTTRFGEIFTVVDGGASATGISDRSTLNISPDDFNPEKVQIDENEDILPSFDFPTVDTGANLGNVTGVVGYSFGNFEIYPTQPFSVDESSLTPEETDIQSGDERLTVATYNVLNLDPNDSDGDEDIANGRYDAIANDIVNNLNTPDIVGLQEIQDDSGSDDDGTVSAEDNLQLLVNEIAQAGGPQYEFIDNIFIENNFSGGQPGGNIRTAFLYDPSRVGLVEGSVETIGSQDDGGAFAGARLPLVADFEFNGQEITVVNNHFSSKGGSSPIFGVDQPFEELQENPDVNGSLDERQAQAQAVDNYVEGILAEDSEANVSVLGDLNEFEFISPVDEILGSDLTNLIDFISEDERYSFIFQGNSQELDHILVSDSLVDGAAIDIVHVNSEFAETPQRASDHDPVIASLLLESAESEVNQINGTNKKDNLVGTDGRDLISGGNGKDILSGKSGDDVLNGGNGKDTLIGGNGDDVLNGGNGKDTFVIAKGQGSDLIEDFSNNDLIGLANGLGFGDLSFSGSNIFLGDEILVSLNGFDTTTLNESNFDIV